MNGNPKQPREILAEARLIQKRVDELATPLRRHAIPTLQSAARRWAVSKFILEQSNAHLGLLLYAVGALVGMLYAAAFYRRFGISVLDFYGTPDLLLSAVASPTVLCVAVAAVLAVLALLLWTYTAYARGFARKEADDFDRSRRERRWTWGLALIAFVAPFLVAWVAGVASAEIIASTKDMEDKPVRVTLRGNSTATTPLPEEPRRTILLGATNGFHFLYECENGRDQTGINCDDGKAFVVPTDNVAAISYDDRKRLPPPTSDVAQAIGQLADAMASDGRDTQISIERVDATLDTEGLEGAVDRLASAMNTLTIRAELTTDTLPRNLHLAPITVVVPGGAGFRHPTYAVPFPTLSPMTTRSEGIAIPVATRDWLGKFYESLSACGEVRVTVTGHASREEFGDDRESIWARVIDEGRPDSDLMNCGLANLRALKVVSTLFDSNGSSIGGKALTAAMEAEKSLHKECPPEGDACFLKAKEVREHLIGLCPPPEPLEWSREDNGVHATVRVRPWRGWDDSWSWLGNDQSHLLDRSAHISLDTESGDRLTCP